MYEQVMSHHFYDRNLAKYFLSIYIEDSTIDEAVFFKCMDKYVVLKAK